jgi:DNA-binding beta-propeller fold protein YncE
MHISSTTSAKASNVRRALLLALGFLTHYRQGSGSHLLVFAADASGDLAPLRTIGGLKHPLNDPSGVAVDGAGNIYVTEDPGGMHLGSIRIYAPRTPRDVTPLRVIESSDADTLAPYGIAIDADQIFVVNHNPL